MTDINTAAMLDEFKTKYFSKVKALHEKYAGFKTLPPEHEKKAIEAANTFYFLDNFIASVEATLEENMVLKNNLNK